MFFFHGFPSFSANKSAARTLSQAPSQPQPTQTAQPTPTPSKKPSRLQNVLRALRLSRSAPKVEEHPPQPQVVHISPVPSQRPCPTTRQTTARSASAEPSAASTPPSFPPSTFSTTGPAQLALPHSAATTPATTYPNTPAPSASNSPFLAVDPAATSKRIADLESTISRLKQDNVRQISETNELLNDKLFGQTIALVEERKVDQAARKVAEDQLAEVVASRAKMEEVLLKEREEHRKAKSARSQVYYALEEQNADLQAALLDVQTKTDFLQVEALQKAHVRLGIVDPEDQQYPLAYPVCGDCMGPFLNAVCTAARQGSRTNSNGGPEHELATAAHQPFELPGDADSCSEPVSDQRARARSKAPAPTEWLKSGSTRTHWLNQFTSL